MRSFLRQLFDPLPGDRRYVRFIGSVGPIGRVPLMTRTGRVFFRLSPGSGISLLMVVNGSDLVFNNDDRVVVPA